jgi:nucleotide-binding universal stress UspA family protein
LTTAAAGRPEGAQEETTLKADAIGFLDALVIGLASTAPAYSLAAPVRSVGDEWKAYKGALEELGQSVVGPAVEKARAAGVEADVELVDERPAEALLQLAAKRDARLIVVGTYGESPLRGAILGSVPHKLLQASDRPVLVVPRAAVAPGGSA